MNKVSVIIPVYNSEKYISDCLDSILTQTYRDIEIVVVDDGSTDETFEICKKYQNIDERIVALRKKNGGVSSARNMGIKKASGEYILFVDSDDMVPENFVEEMINNVDNDSVMVVCGFVEKTIKNTKEFAYKKKIDKNKFDFLMYAYNSIGGFCWNKIYSRKIIMDKNIRFDEKIKNYEDMLFNMQYISYIETIKYIKSTKYIYNQRKDSAVKADNDKVFNEISKAVLAMRSVVDDDSKKALDYITLEESIRTRHSIEHKIFRKYLLDMDVPFSRRSKIFLKKVFYPMYKSYAAFKKRGYYEN